MIHASSKRQPYNLGMLVRGQHSVFPYPMSASISFGQVKRDKLIDGFRKAKFELLALTKDRLKGNGKV